MRAEYYILDGHDPIPVADVVTWGMWFQTGGPPLLFETMIFGPPEIPPALRDLHEAQWRYTTWAEAEAGHAAAVGALRAALKTVTL